jgi:hypothetical protein
MDLNERGSSRRPQQNEWAFFGIPAAHWQNHGTRYIQLKFSTMIGIRVIRTCQVPTGPVDPAGEPRISKLLIGISI